MSTQNRMSAMQLLSQDLNIEYYLELNESDKWAKLRVCYSTKQKFLMNMNNITANTEQLVSTASSIVEICGKILSSVYYRISISKAI
jgi:hypothetical protein